MHTLDVLVAEAHKLYVAARPRTALARADTCGAAIRERFSTAHRSR